jgi:hypothetical protein
MAARSSDPEEQSALGRTRRESPLDAYDSPPHTLRGDYKNRCHKPVIK